MGFAFPKLSYRASQRANMMRRTGHKQQTFRALGLLSFCLSALIASPSLAQTNSQEQLSAQLSALRAEVETLSNKVRQAQEVRNDRLRALEHSHTELQIALTKARSQHKLLTANKKTLLVQQQMEDLGFDPIESMIEINRLAMAKEDYSLAGQMAKELAQYVYPKRKSIEQTSEEIDLPPMEVVVQFVD